MSDILDLNALAVEETGEPFKFKHGKKTYSVSPVVDIRVTAALRVGDWARAVEILLGAEQWETLISSGTPMSFEQAIALVNGVTAHIGTTPGKSRASRRSSKTTATPSKRTSSSTSRRGSRD